MEREGFEPEERVRKRPEAVSTEPEAALPQRGGGPKAGINPSLSADEKKLPAYRRLFLLLSFEMWNGRDLNPKRGFENGQRPFPESPKRLCPKGSSNNNHTIACRTPG
ncbi:MAG TPA: hypothetical protein DEQ23_09005 [Chlorobium sp.]|nr:hypothetical protein [Chlorobium sp.]